LPCRLTSGPRRFRDGGLTPWAMRDGNPRTMNHEWYRLAPPHERLTQGDMVFRCPLLNWHPAAIEITSAAQSSERLKQRSAWFKVHDRGATASPSRTSPPGIPLQRPSSPPQRRRRRRPPHPHGEHRAARAVALPTAPMPQGLETVPPPTPLARSHGAATTC
jgi:hypothetical protein